MKVEKKEEKGRKKTKGTRSRGIVIKKNGNGKQKNMILSSRFWKTFQVGHGEGRSVEPYTPLQIIQTQRRQTLFSLNAFIIVGYVYNIT